MLCEENCNKIVIYIKKSHFRYMAVYKMFHVKHFVSGKIFIFSQKILSTEKQ